MVRNIGFSEAPDLDAAGVLQAEIGRPRELKAKRLQRILDRIFPPFPASMEENNSHSDAELFLDLINEQRITLL